MSGAAALWTSYARPLNMNKTTGCAGGPLHFKKSKQGLLLSECGPFTHHCPMRLSSQTYLLPIMHTTTMITNERIVAMMHRIVHSSKTMQENK